MSISKELRQEVITVAGDRCEYCKTSAQLTGLTLVMDHILPQSLGGSNERNNLAAACYRCNEFKGSKTHERDPESGQFVALFNPRYQLWVDNFLWVNGGTHLAGSTAIGRASVIALRLNRELLVGARAIWISSGWHPPGKFLL